MPAKPQSHIEDALKLQADGRLHLYEINPLGGGTVFIKSDDNFVWQGDLYTGIPCSLTGEKMSTEGTPTPKLVIGQKDLDLLPFKALINDGHLDGAQIIRRKVLLDDALADLNISETTYFRVKRIDNYNRTNITLTLASFSGAISQTIPFRSYTTPDFPFVSL